MSSSVEISTSVVNRRLGYGYPMMKIAFTFLFFIFQITNAEFQRPEWPEAGMLDNFISFFVDIVARYANRF